MAIPGSRPNNRLVLIIGILCAFLAFGGVLFLLKNSGGGPTQKVLVAKADIAAGTPLTADLVSQLDLPQAAVPRDVLTDPSQVVGKQIVNNVTANTPLVPALVVAPGQTSASAAGGPTLKITQSGYVALAIPTSFAYAAPPPTESYLLSGGSADLVSVGNYIQPEDHIDILVAFGTPSGPEMRYSFQDLRVLKVGSATAATAAGAAPATGGSVLVVELPRNEAELLAWMVGVGNTGAATAPPGHAAVVAKYVLRPRCEYGDLNYAQDVKSLIGTSIDDLNNVAKTPAVEHDKAMAKLHAQCINPYPNYLPAVSTDPNVPNALPTVRDSPVTPQTLQGLFQIP